MKMISAAALATLLMAGAASAQAPGPGGPRPPLPPPAPGVPEALALEAAQTAVSTCAANGYQVGVTVIDSAAGVRLVLGVDGVRQMGIDSSGKKAFTALTLMAPTSQLEAQAKTDTALQAKIAADPRLFARAGAVLISMGGKVVGAIGVGGAPGGEQDEVCALAGVAKIASRLK